MRCSVKNEKELQAFAAKLAPKLRGGTTLGLIGQLGAGKTAFVRALLAALGSSDKVSSPTFVLQHRYDIPGGILEHWDIYRLNRAPEDLFDPPPADTIRCIEWCDRDKTLLAETPLHITLSAGNDPAGERRELELSPELARIFPV